MNRSEEIHNIFCNRGTDKAFHAYAPVYSIIDPGIKSMIEIGVFRGQSIAAWTDIFTKARVYGIDVSVNTSSMPYPVYDTSMFPMVKLIQADATRFNYNLLNDTFDLVVDDGSHHLEHQIDTWKRLWLLLNPGGYYIIEDVLPENADKFLEQLEYLIGVVGYDPKDKAEVLDTGSDKNEYNRVVKVVKSACCDAKIVAAQRGLRS